MRIPHGMLLRWLRVPFATSEFFCPFCDTVCDIYMDHALCCSGVGDCTKRHNLVRNQGYHTSARAGLCPELEKYGCNTPSPGVGGGWGNDAHIMWKKCASAIAAATGEQPHAVAEHIHQNMSIIIRTEGARAVLRRLQGLDPSLSPRSMPLASLRLSSALTPPTRAPNPCLFFL